RPGEAAQPGGGAPAPEGEEGEHQPHGGQGGAQRQPGDLVEGHVGSLGSALPLHPAPPPRTAGRAAQPTSERSKPTSAWVSAGSTVTPGCSGIGSRLGTATTRHPAATAEATPFGESSSATERAGSAESIARAVR